MAMYPDNPMISIREVEREIEAYQQGVAAYLAARPVGEGVPFDQAIAAAYVRGWEAAREAARVALERSLTNG